MRSRCRSVARSTRPLASRRANTGRRPTAQTLSLRAATIRPSGETANTSGSVPTSLAIGTRRPSDNHTSVSPVTHSLRSDNCGRWPERDSGARDNCESASTGTCSSLAKPLSEREISPISRLRFSGLPVPRISCR